MLYYTWKINQRIMEAERCYLNWMKTLWQYISQRKMDSMKPAVFFIRIEKDREGSRRGVPEFYVVVHGDENQKSFILLNGEETDAEDFQLHSWDTAMKNLKSFIENFAGKF